MDILLFLIFMPGTYIFMAIFDAEDSVIGSENLEQGYYMPWISLSLPAIGFALITFFFVLDPIIIDANPISIWLVVIFSLIWSGGYSLGLTGTIPCLIYIKLLVHSQYLPDTRDYWSKLMSPDSGSLALKVIGFTCMYVILFGSRLSGMNSILQSDYKSRFRILLSTASIGIGLAFTIHFGIQTNNMLF
jgi:hypothetical protein